jgi:hypothetical protein
MTGVDLAWMDAAACAERLDLPWTLDSAGVSVEQADGMRAVCRGCSVLSECAAAAGTWTVTGGWWAGSDRDADRKATDPVRWAPVVVRGRQLAGVEQGLLPMGGAA